MIRAHIYTRRFSESSWVALALNTLTHFNCISFFESGKCMWLLVSTDDFSSLLQEVFREFHGFSHVSRTFYEKRERTDDDDCNGAEWP